MSVPSKNVILTSARSDDAVADSVSIRLMVPNESSKGRTTSLSTSSGDEEG